MLRHLSAKNFWSGQGGHFEIQGWPFILEAFGTEVPAGYVTVNMFLPVLTLCSSLDKEF